MMYYKMIGDRQVFSDCRTIQTDEGVWISNPTEEQIAAYREAFRKSPGKYKSLQGYIFAMEYAKIGE